MLELPILYSSRSKMQLNVDAMEESRKAFANPTLNRLLLFVYLVPVFGLVPAMWVLSRRNSDRQQRAVSRLAVTLGLVWGLGSLCLNMGFQLTPEVSPQSISVTVLVLNSVLTSGYFVTMLWLMTQVWRRQSLNIPGISRVADYLP